MLPPPSCVSIFTYQAENCRYLPVQQLIPGYISHCQHNLHVAKTYIAKAGLREFRDEVMTGVRDLKGSLATLHERMDRFIEPNARRNKPPER